MVSNHNVPGQASGGSLPVFCAHTDNSSEEEKHSTQKNVLNERGRS